MMNIYRNRFSYNFDAEGNVIDAIVGFNGMNDDGGTAMASIRVTKDQLGDGKTFDDVNINQVTQLAKEKWVKMITGEEKANAKQES